MQYQCCVVRVVVSGIWIPEVLWGQRKRKCADLNKSSRASTIGLIRVFGNKTTVVSCISQWTRGRSPGRCQARCSHTIAVLASFGLPLAYRSLQDFSLWSDLPLPSFLSKKPCLPPTYPGLFSQHRPHNTYRPAHAGRPSFITINSGNFMRICFFYEDLFF